MTDGDFTATAEVLQLPRDSWLGGNARSFGRDGLAFYEHCERLGPLVRGRAYVFDFYVVTGPKLIEEILVKKASSFHKPGLLKGLRILFGEGLLTADGDHWRHRRRNLQPAFHPRRNAEYGTRISESIEDEFRSWKSDVVVDVHEAVSALCLRNLTRALFGIEDRRITDAANGLAELTHEITQAAMSFHFPYYGLIAMFPELAKVPFGKRQRRLEETLIQTVTELTRGRTDDGFFSRLTGMDDLDGCPISKKGIRDELVTMFLAGHETVAAGVSWSLYLLARHPEVLQRLVDELDRVCGDALPHAEDLASLPFLDKVVLETYRLYPPTHRIGRRVVEPVTIGGVPIDVGANVLMPQWAIHRSERHFDAPLEFRPERWTPEFSESLPRYAYFPFGGGPRVCIGQSLAVTEHALVVGAIAKAFAFSLTTNDPIPPIEGLTLVPGPGFRLRMSRRPPGGPRGPRPVPQPLSSTQLLAGAPSEPEIEA